MRKTEKNQMLKGLLLTFVFAFGVFTWCSDSVVGLAAGTAKVVASSGKIRKSADTGSETLASVKKGDKLDVIASKTADDGYTWYKVYVDDEETGYIRADLVTVDGTISAERTSEKKEEKKEENNNTTTTSESGGNKTVVGSNNSTTTEKKEETKTETKTEVAVVNVSETDVATAKATADVRVRKGAGTNYDVAGSAKNGTEVTVSGVAADSEGKNWYQVSFNEGNKTVNGFIREDFLEVLTRAEEEPVEEEPAEETSKEEEPVVENQDYYLKYMQNDTGEMDWYLFDNIQGNSQSLTTILDVIEQVENKELKETKQLSTMRIIVIALAVAVFVLIVVVTILIFKLRDAYEYEYEDGDEDDEDDEYDEEETEEENEDEEEEEPVRKPRFGFLKKKEVVEDDEEDEEEEETLKEIQPVQPPKSPKAENSAWQSKDFLELDDDMEFEFLDL